jgi:hypothetical protein
LDCVGPPRQQTYTPAPLAPVVDVVINPELMVSPITHSNSTSMMAPAGTVISNIASDSYDPAVHQNPAREPLGGLEWIWRGSEFPRAVSRIVIAGPSSLSQYNDAEIEVPTEGGVAQMSILLIRIAWSNRTLLVVPDPVLVRRWLNRLARVKFSEIPLLDI